MSNLTTKHLLIEPFGIETMMVLVVLTLTLLLLIEPFGIETIVKLSTAY